MEPQPARDLRRQRPHHLASVADAFLSSPAAHEHPQRMLVVAGPGVGATGPVASALSHLDHAGSFRDLGDSVGVRLPRWEREGMRLGGVSVLVWCVTGTDAVSLVSGLILGRLAALLEPVAATVVWIPERSGRTDGEPEQRSQALARRLIRTAVPRARVGLHCLGWAGNLDAELHSLSMRFS